MIIIITPHIVSGTMGVVCPAAKLRLLDNPDHIDGP